MTRHAAESFPAFRSADSGDFVLQPLMSGWIRSPVEELSVLANVSRPFDGAALFWTGLSVPFKQRRNFV